MSGRRALQKFKSEAEGMAQKFNASRTQRRRTPTKIRMRGKSFEQAMAASRNKEIAKEQSDVPRGAQQGTSYRRREGAFFD